MRSARLCPHPEPRCRDPQEVESDLSPDPPHDPAPHVSTKTSARTVFDDAITVTTEEVRRAYDTADPFTVGVEEELMIVDRETHALVDSIGDIEPLVEGERFHRELSVSSIEVTTPVARSAAEIQSALADARRTLSAADPDRVVAAAGLHPYDSEVQTCDLPRYEALKREYQWAARRDCTFGLHVHVEVRGADTALKVYNALRSYLPELIALGANSPFYEGAATGLADTRLKITEMMPRHGVPPRFSSWDDFVDLLEWGSRSGSIPDFSYLWWDMRPHPRFGTIEVRVLDAQTNTAHTAALAAIVRALVASLTERVEAGEELALHPERRIDENRWSALRWGLTGHMADLDSGESEATRVRCARLLESLAPYAARLGDAQHHEIAWSLLRGNGSDRQRAVASEGGIGEVLPWLVAESFPALSPAGG